jgi:hypothetical protein
LFVVGAPRADVLIPAARTPRRGLHTARKSEPKETRMSSSRSQSRNSRSTKKARAAAPQPPWIDDDIDYGPANAAVLDLATWALDIAERDVADSPADRRRVRNTRRYVLARLDGKHTRRLPVEDVIFTASLLARIFDDDLGLDLSDAFTIFDTLDLPTELVPVPRPMRPTARAPRPHVHAPPPLRLCDECGYVHEPGLHAGRNAA